MSFKMRCPKCGSVSYTIERDNRTYTGGKVGEFVFACRCGKQLFGDQLTAEYERQRSAWEADPERSRAEQEKERRKREAEEQEAQLKKAFEYRRAWVAQRRAASPTAPALAGASVVESEPPPPPPAPARRVEPPPPPPAPAPAAQEATPQPESPEPDELDDGADVDGQENLGDEADSGGDESGDRSEASNKPTHLCEWEGCTNPRAPNSKYCSRACSNKNARFRHAQRKKGPSAAA